MKPLKLVIDRPTLGCLLNGLNEAADISLRRAEEWGEDMDYETTATYWLLRETFAGMRDRADRDATHFKAKVQLSGAMALRYLCLITSPLDEWTNIQLIALCETLDRYILERLREALPGNSITAKLSDHNLKLLK